MVASKKIRSGSETQFPGKLHDMMKFVEEHGLQDGIISWELNGYGFKINDPERLVEILPLFFGQTKYRSFRRQLNMWHFHRILKDTNGGTLNYNNGGIFVHPYFVKHNRALCAQMSRQIPFKPTPEKEREYIAMATCIVEPDPIREEPSSSAVSCSMTLLDTKAVVSQHNTSFLDPRNYCNERMGSTSNGTIGSFQLSDCHLPAKVQQHRRSSSNMNFLPPIPQLSNSRSSSIEEVLQTIDEVNNTLAGLNDDLPSSFRQQRGSQPEQEQQEQQEEDYLMKMAEDLHDEIGSYEGMNFFLLER